MAEAHPDPDTPQVAPPYLAFCCALSIFLGAFLLFQVQPLISKMILPWFGGSPAVWTTCMLFFQVLLLAGYAYAHQLEKVAMPHRKAAVHVALLGTACLLLPITRAEAMQPVDSTHPVTKILLLLTLSLGLPYFVVSSTGPLVQAWFARLYPSRSPYRLYALSNVGSLAALLSYPILVEPLLSVRRQGHVWSTLFLVFASLTAGLAISTAKWGVCVPLSLHQSVEGEKRPRFGKCFLTWFCLPALASVMLLAVTNQLCQNVAVIPMLWIAPLSIYLISFIICFDKGRWYQRLWFSISSAVMIVIISKLLLTNRNSASSWWYVEPELVRWLAESQFAQIVLYLIGLFVICMLCHGEMVRAKPSPQYLTTFYLAVSAGGAVGGSIVSLLCPLVFSTYFELNIGLAISFILALTVCFRGARTGWLQRPLLRNGFLVVAALGVAVVFSAQAATMSSGARSVHRNFYGVLSIQEGSSRNLSDRSRSMYSGAAMHGAITLHGKQYLDPEYRDEPTLYYTHRSGVGLAFAGLRSEEPMHVGAIGLGVGTIAVYGRLGDSFEFYEINPLVEQLAREHFTYLEGCLATMRVAIGDGRALLEFAEPQGFDLLVVDAFSGDTIPAHLLTHEAFSLYLNKHLNPNGVLAVHVSNRHMNLIPVVARQAVELNVPCVFVKTSGRDGMGGYPSTWMLLTRNEGFLSKPEITKAAQRVPATANQGKLWTDQYNTVFRLLVRGAAYLEEDIKNAPYLADD